MNAAVLYPLREQIRQLMSVAAKGKPSLSLRAGSQQSPVHECSGASYFVMGLVVSCVKRIPCSSIRSSAGSLDCSIRSIERGRHAAYRSYQKTLDATPVRLGIAAPRQQLANSSRKLQKVLIASSLHGPTFVSTSAQGTIFPVSSFLSSLPMIPHSRATMGPAVSLRLYHPRAHFPFLFGGATMLKRAEYFSRIATADRIAMLLVALAGSSATNTINPGRLPQLKYRYIGPEGNRAPPSREYLVKN